MDLRTTNFGDHIHMIHKPLLEPFQEPALEPWQEPWCSVSWAHHGTFVWEPWWVSWLEPWCSSHEEPPCSVGLEPELEPCDTLAWEPGGTLELELGLGLEYSVLKVPITTYQKTCSRLMLDKTNAMSFLALMFASCKIAMGIWLVQ